MITILLEVMLQKFPELSLKLSFSEDICGMYHIITVQLHI